MLYRISEEFEGTKGVYRISEEFEGTKGVIIKRVNRRWIDKTIVKRKSTMMYKTLHRNSLKIEQHEPH